MEKRKNYVELEEKYMKIEKKIKNLKKKNVIREPNWTHILKEPYCMVRTYRGLELKKIVK